LSSSSRFSKIIILMKAQM